MLWLARPKSRAIKHMIDSFTRVTWDEEGAILTGERDIEQRKSNPMVSERMKRIYRRLREANIKE